MREHWIDRLRGWLILLVVLGHAFGSVSVFASQAQWPVCHYGYKWIYLFHMPAFFILAGWLWRESAVESWTAWLSKKAKRLLVPYFSFGVFSILVFSVLSSVVGGASDYWANLGGGGWWAPWASLAYGAAFPGTDGFRCNSVLWFLPCMFSVVVIWQGLSVARFRLPHVAFDIVVVAAGMVVYLLLAALQVPRLPYGLNLAPKYLAFLALGVLTRPWVGKMLSVGSWKKWLGLALGSAFYSLVVWYVPYDDGIHADPLRQVFVFGVSAFGTFLFAALSRLNKWSWLSMCGMASVGIMMMHKFPLLAAQLALRGVFAHICCGWWWPIVTAFALAGGAVVFCLAATAVIRRVCPKALGEGWR